MSVQRKGIRKEYKGDTIVKESHTAVKMMILYGAILRLVGHLADKNCQMAFFIV